MHGIDCLFLVHSSVYPLITTSFCDFTSAFFGFNKKTSHILLSYKLSSLLKCGKD